MLLHDGICMCSLAFRCAACDLMMVFVSLFVSVAPGGMPLLSEQEMEHSLGGLERCDYPGGGRVRPGVPCDVAAAGGVGVASWSETDMFIALCRLTYWKSAWFSVCPRIRRNNTMLLATLFVP
jgi:hypothetical protein